MFIYLVYSIVASSTSPVTAARHCSQYPIVTTGHRNVIKSSLGAFLHSVKPQKILASKSVFARTVPAIGCVNITRIVWYGLLLLHCIEGLTRGTWNRRHQERILFIFAQFAHDSAVNSMCGCVCVNWLVNIFYPKYESRLLPLAAQCHTCTFILILFGPIRINTRYLTPNLTRVQ